MTKNIAKIGIAALILLAIAMLFLVQSVSAVQVSENVKFQTTGTNTTFIMGNNFTFDTIEVHSTYLMLDNATISVCPSVGSIDFTLFNFTIEYKKWNESCNNPGAITNHTIGGLKTNTTYLVKVNGAIWEHYMSNDSGYVFFTYSGGYSDIVFEMEETGLMEGDVELNKCVSLKDSTLIKLYLIGKGKLTPDQLKCADTHDDGIVTLKDSTAIKKWVVDPDFPLWQSPADDHMMKPVPC